MSIIVETEVFDLAELKEKHPEGYERAFEDYQKKTWEWETPCIEETFKSIESVIEASGFSMRNWSLGNSSNRSQDISLRENYYLDDLAGHKALAHFLKVLIKHGYERPKHFKEMQFPGVCGFTGYCFDDDCAEAVWKDLLSGSSLREALSGLDFVYAKQMDAEEEYQRSEESFECWADGMTFTAEGEEF